MSMVMWMKERREGCGGSADWGCDSEQIAGIRSACGRSSSLLGENPLNLPGLSPDDENIFRQHAAVYAGFESSFSSAAEEQTYLSLLGRLDSIRLEDDVNVSAEPYGFWGALGDVASASDSINDSFDESRTSLANPTPRFLHPHRILPEPVDPLYNQSFGLWENSSDIQFQALNAFSEVILGSHRHSFDSNDQWEISSPPISPQTVLTGSHPNYDLPREQKESSLNAFDLDYSIPMMNYACMNASEVWNDGTVSKNPRISPSPKANHKSSTMRKLEPLKNVRGSIAQIAKDQHGCRHLQRILAEGMKEEKDMIFNEISYHALDLMVDPFGNYLVQKVFEVCTEEQRLEIVSILTNHHSELVKVALNMHGTRALQKLIEVLKSEEEMGLFMSAIQSSFLNLVTDPNGNHVVQRCLRHFSYEQSKFIFEAAARYCLEIATHRHGCCVLQQCISRSTGDHKEKLLQEVSLNGLTLAQDAYGNYAVQYILDTQNDSAIGMLKFRFKGNYAHLSMQKFSSNVVEKCLRVFDDIGRKMIVSELLSISCFDALMQDPYANYVIQSALLVCKGQLRNSLTDAIRSRSALRSNPYCRGIFNLLKK